MKPLIVASSNLSSHKSATPCPPFFCLKSLLSSLSLPFICHILRHLSYHSSLALYILHHVSPSFLSHCFIHVCARTTRYAVDTH